MNLTDRLEPWMNPLLLKELRQGLRSRALAVSAMGSLLVCLFSYSIAAAEEGRDGAGLAMVVGFCLCVVSLVIVPNGIRSQLAQDFQSRTFELVRVAGLSPWRLAMGLYLGGAARVLFVVALMAPFLVATVLVGGVVFEQIAVGLMIVVAAASLAVAGIVALGAVAETSPFGRLLGRAIPVLPFLWFLAAGSFVSGVIGPYVQTKELVYVAAMVGTIGTIGTLFLLRLAADALMPDGVRTFLGTRLALIPAVAALAAVAIAGDDGRGEPEWVLLVASGASPWLLGLVATRAGPGSRALPWPLRDGFGPNLLWSAGVLVAIGAALSVPSSDVRPVVTAARIALFFAESCAFARLAHALVDRRRTDGAWFIVLFLIVQTMAGMGGVFLEALDALGLRSWQVGALFLTALTDVDYRTRYGWEVWPALATAAALGLSIAREGRRG